MKVTQKQKLTYILGLILGGVVLAQGVSALTYQSEVSPEFTWDPSLSISFEAVEPGGPTNSLQIASLVPGGSANSNAIVVKVSTNNISGYSLTATVGNATNATTSLKNGDNVFESTSSSVATLDGGKWGYSVSTNNGTSWSNYGALNLYTAAAGTLINSSSSAGEARTQFRIGASALANQVSGEYTNVINFTAVTNMAQ